MDSPPFSPVLASTPALTKSQVQLCGDPTCESSGCDSFAFERWEAEQDRIAREYVRGLIREAASTHRLPLPEGF